MYLIFQKGISQNILKTGFMHCKSMSNYFASEAVTKKSQNQQKSLPCIMEPDSTVLSLRSECGLPLGNARHISPSKTRK